MEFGFKFKLIGNVLCGLIKKDIKNKDVIKEIKWHYKDIITRAKDIGPNNNLITSYLLAAFFIAMNRGDNLTPDQNIDILEKELKNSKLIKIFMGNAKSYFSEKAMKKRRAWSKETYKKKYKNDWVVEVIEKSDDFVFGFNYHECGVCKLCKDEHCFSLAKYLCKLDYMLVELIGIKLNRTKTLAEGGDYCDFRFKEK